MARSDGTRPFIPVNIAVLTVSDTRAATTRQAIRSRDTLRQAIAWQRAQSKRTTPARSNDACALDRRCRDRRDHHRPPGATEAFDRVLEKRIGASANCSAC
jgi:hypothetical protein